MRGFFFFIAMVGCIVATVIGTIYLMILCFPPTSLDKCEHVKFISYEPYEWTATRMVLMGKSMHPQSLHYKGYKIHYEGGKEVVTTENAIDILTCK